MAVSYGLAASEPVAEIGGSHLRLRIPSALYTAYVPQRIPCAKRAILLACATRLVLLDLRYIRVFLSIPSGML